MTLHTLTERAMVMNLSIGTWQGHRLDKEASRRVTSAAGASADAARVNKHLVSKTALAPIVSAAGAVRSHFYENSLPWRDNGDRLMTRKLYLTFIEGHEALVRDFDYAVTKFIEQDYQAAIEQAEFRMGELFQREDYPHSSDLRRRFYATLDIDAIATANDFRVDIDKKHVEKVRSQMETAAEERLRGATQDVCKRVVDIVGYFADRMNTPDAVFRDSTVANLEDLMVLLPGLNVLDDPEIEDARQKIADKLTGHTAKDIRKDLELREELGAEAQAIVDKMAGYMRAFGAQEGSK